MKRTATIAIALIAAIGCGDPSSGGLGGAGGEVGSGWAPVLCDEVEVLDRGEGATTRHLEAVYPGVEEGTASFRFCDFWSLNNGVYTESEADCTEGSDPLPGFYRDGDLHIVCNELVVYADGSSLEVGAGRIYVRFDEEATAGAGADGGLGGDAGAGRLADRLRARL